MGDATTRPRLSLSDLPSLQIETSCRMPLPHFAKP
jgi:hypothetical protein